MSEGYTKSYIAEDGTPMVDMYVWNAEAGEEDYVGSIPAHWGPTEESEEMYSEDLAFAVENTGVSAKSLVEYLRDYDNPDVPVIVETPDGPLAIGGLEMKGGVLTIFTLEG